MIKKILFISIFMLCSFLTFNNLLISSATDERGNNMNFYEKKWKEVSLNEGKGLSKSALEIIKKIYNKAIEEKNDSEIIKSTIYSLKFRAILEEDTHEKIINELETEIKTFSSPSKEIMYSMLAEIYWQYYENNRYKFSQRSQVADVTNDDVSTWDLTKIIKKIMDLYLLSIENDDITKSSDINKYKEIIEQYSNTQKRRPTLYDLLAYRALDFFINEQANLLQPAYKFELTDKNYFDNSEQFKKIEIKTKDTNSLKYNAFIILQKLIEFHSSDKNPEALIDADLKRLRFIKANFVGEDKDILYMQALNSLLAKNKAYSISCDIIYEIANYYSILGDSYKPEIKEEYKSYKNKALALCDEAISKFPSVYEAENCKYLKNEIQKKAVKITTEKINIPDKPFLSLVEYKNTDKLFFRIIKLNELQVKASYKKSRDSYEKLIEFYKSIKPTEEWEQNLPKDDDYNMHSVEIKCPKLLPDYYIILASGDKEFSIKNNIIAYSSLWISNLAFIKRTNQKDGNIDIYVFNRDSGEPLKSITGNIYETVYNYNAGHYDYKKRESYITDNNGYFKIKASNRNIVIELIGKDDKLFLDDYYYQSIPYNYNYKKYMTIFFTDRSIYRPGQTVYFKGIVIDNDNKNNKIVSNYNTIIAFYDVNNEKITEQNFTTNQYGTFSGTFIAPVGRLNGNMYLKANDNSGSVNISVEEYKRPKFEVSFEDLKGSFKVGEQVLVKGFAKAYAGSNIDNANVKYRVVRNAEFPYWYWWWGYYPSIEAMEILNGSAKTKNDGSFEISFNAIPDLKIPKEQKPVFTYTVYADVIDINGETHSSSTSVKIGYVALSVSLNISDSINIEGENKFEIISKNLSGTDENSNGKIKITKLKSPSKYYKNRLWSKPDKFLVKKEEFEKDFPNDLYDDEINYYKWDKDQAVYDNGYDTAKDKYLTLADITKWNQGVYLLELKTKDKFGTDILYTKYITLNSTKNNLLPYPQIFSIQDVKIDGEPGEEVKLNLGSSSDSTVIYELENEGKIIETKLIKISNQKIPIEIPIKEDYRGNFIIHFAMVKNNRYFGVDKTIYVPWSNKELKLEFLTFRDKLYPGQKEEWKLKISGKNKDKLAAEMVATLYDASLNAFKPHYWYFNIYPTNYSSLYWEYGASFNTTNFCEQDFNWNPYYYYSYYYYTKLNWFGFAFNYYYPGMYDEMEQSKGRFYKEDAPSPRKKMSLSVKRMKDGEEFAESDKKEEESRTEKSTEPNVKVNEDSTGKKTEDKMETVQVRKNFNETAFFYPHLETDENGEIIIAFTIPEALTKWKMLGFAHTKNLEYGFIDNTLVTQKDLMIMPNPPRFLRENDTIYFSSKITNLSDKNLSGTAMLQLFDAITMKPIDSLLKNDKHDLEFNVKKKESTSVSWKLVIPVGIQAVTYRVIAKTDKFSDGEEASLPVLTNRMLVTESMPLPMRGKGTKEFKMQKLLDAKKSNTIQHEKLTLEYTSNPSWYAIQALPYLMEYPYECAEQTFSRLYANSIASHIVNSNPKIKKVFDSWKDTDALLSNLQKNEELKSLLLEETPWVYEAKNEEARKKMIAVLFDLNKMSNELNSAIKKLSQMQVSNGGFPWFAGLPDDRYITQHIIAGLAKLIKLNIAIVKDNYAIQTMISRGIDYLDNEMKKDYDYLVKNKINLEQDNIWWTEIHYLYTRSFYTDKPISAFNKTAFEYWKNQAEKYWLGKSRYMQGLIAIALSRYGNQDKAMDIIKSLKENSIDNEELGMYWKENAGGYYWYEAPIETEALLIEAFYEVAKDMESVEAMKVWLLKQKQVQDWKTTKATVDACYALLLRGMDWLSEDTLIDITLGDLKVNPANMPNVKAEAGTGYFKTAWTGMDIKENMGDVKVVKATEGVSWGSLYWQYFEQLDKITPHATPLKLTKQLFLQKNTPTGPVINPITDKTVLSLGDLLVVRITLAVDRNMEYIHMKDMRASGLEPVNVLSTYKYQDGLWYYESTKDAATNFFIPNLYKGKYVFEYQLRVNNRGNFSNGITTIQSMYAPEFTSHSEGVRIEVK